MSAFDWDQHCTSRNALEERATDWDDDWMVEAAAAHDPSVGRV
jgi:hypothetical protein